MTMKIKSHSQKHGARGDFAADRRLLLLTCMALPIGVICAGVARLLTMMISLFTNLFYYHSLNIEARAPSYDAIGIAAIAMPALGGLIIGLMARYGSERIRGHGIPEALEAILFGKSIMSPKVALLKPLSSAISIGSGGPFGAEGPIIMTGGAFGSIFGQIFHLSSAERKTLLVAGASAGMAAIFATPIAATLLAVELLLFEWKPRSLVPVALASAVAAAVRPFFLGSAGPLFPLPAILPASLSGLAFAALAGLLAGAFSTVLSMTLYKVEDLFGRLPIHWSWWPALGGIIVGIGGYFQPHALGVGYDVIERFLSGHAATGEVAGLVLVKGFIWTIALASGTSGGVLAPLLIMGAGLGVVEAGFFPGGDSSLWPLVSMAAVMGGMMRSPFTAVMFALELTNSVNSLPALLIASICSYAFTVLVMKRSILTEKVARRGYDIFREYGVDPLERMTVAEAMTKDVQTVPAKMITKELAAQMFGTVQKHRGYPVVDDAGRLIGMIASSDLRRIVGSGVNDILTAEAVMAKPPLVALPDEPCKAAAERMATAGIGRLPVVSREDRSKLIGILTRSDLLKSRTRHVEEEFKTERILRFF